MISSVVFFENYAASFTALLSVVKLAAPFADLKDLYENTDYKIGSVPGTAYKSILAGVSIEQNTYKNGV